jgi:hypothetical protein
MFVSMKPWDHEAWFEYGRALYLRKNYLDAMLMMDKCLDINPSNNEAIVLRDECLRKMKEGLEKP